MTTYLSPGIYVKEVSSGAVSIAGVGTSTAGFIGIISSEDSSDRNSSENPPSSPTPSSPTSSSPTSSSPTSSSPTPSSPTPSSPTPSSPTPSSPTPSSPTSSSPTSSSPTSSAVNSRYRLQKVVGEVVGKVDGTTEEFTLSRYPVDSKDVVVNVKGVTNQPTATVKDDTQQKVSTITLNPAPAPNAQVTVDYYPVSAAGEVQLCTNFTEFKKYFGDFSKVVGQSNLAHAVYGFFRNGGTRCFVTWVAKEPDISRETDISGALEDFAAIDEIAIVAAPGSTDKAVLENLSSHCQELGDRVAILDAPHDATVTTLNPGGNKMPGRSNYAALYYPWIQVLDPATNQKKYVPPSGHIAGVYARVDAQRGVHKAPANEAILGAIGLETALTRAKQEGLNPQGVNCIRNLNGNITVWGARTWGGDANGEFKYVNIRRLFNFLRESIDEGTQWVVFEPNSPELWARVRRSVTAFLTMVWRSGALFGATPEEAFFVQCDAETNPPEVRDAGQLIVKIGVAVVKPAEFVIFELSQWSGGK
ncbi:phage tail sheath family protein [Phormidium sp. CLA17]|uniref:phage tail sheath family protein n=1 Tax=Leptolyngbya sp. Cla-17 TaxID=2803751 RepID=UPI0018D6FD5C|nr:phage tail sheath subtilisin-like domain-containing protein [Leptolyngbya sp. Cla-17]MBM0744176.1 phage tail sheath family protein [Leptolyngbya sp. Cla-17]